ncbi:MAG: peptide deformylase [Pseudomonadota bacterium]
MTVRNVIEYPDPRLRELSAPVTDFDERLRQIVTDLIDTMHDANSIGLSAPQINVRQQILVMDHSEDQSSPEVYINPEILGRGGYGLIEESCVSVPGVSAMVMRSTHLNVRAFDQDGAAFESTLTGMPAVCMQHEMDHFDGKLVADRMNWFRRRRLDARLKQAATA